MTAHGVTALGKTECRINFRLMILFLLLLCLPAQVVAVPELGVAKGVEKELDQRSEWIAGWEFEWKAESIFQSRYFLESTDDEGDGRNGAASQPFSDYQLFPAINQRLGFNASDDSGDHQVVGNLFFHYDQRDEKNRYGDIRELNWLYSFSDYQFRLGVGQVNWGVNEIFRTVDIINQSDTQTWPSRQKLGQPMASLAGYFGDHLLEAYVLFDHRKRRYAGENGRLRYPILIDETPIYDRGATGIVDFALRWQFNFWDTDISISHIYGVDRGPYFTFNFDFDNPLLVPVYQKVNQTSIELTRTFGDILAKLEVKHQMGGLQRYYSYAGGFEYSSSGIFGSDLFDSFDMTYYVEAIFDDREISNNNVLDRDVALAMRMAFNDRFDSSLLVALVGDYEYEERMMLLHFSSNVNAHLKIDAVVNVFHSSEPVPDRISYDEAWSNAFEAIETGNLPLPVQLVTSIYSSVSELTLSKRDFDNLVEFMNEIQQPGGYKASYAETVPDVLFDLMQVTDESQKVNLLDGEDYVALSLSYLF